MFYEQVKLLCKKNCLPITKFAEEIGLTKSATTGWKKGCKPKQETIKLVADYFGVDESYFETEKLQQKAPAAEPVKSNSGDDIVIMNPNYRNLTPENRALVDLLIAQLAKAQSDN